MTEGALSAFASLAAVAYSHRSSGQSAVAKVSILTELKAYIKAEVWAFLLFGALRCVLTQCRKENASTLILEKQLLSFNLGKVTSQFPNNLKSIKGNNISDIQYLSFYSQTFCCFFALAVQVSLLNHSLHNTWS